MQIFVNTRLQRKTAMQQNPRNFYRAGIFKVDQMAIDFVTLIQANQRSLLKTTKKGWSVPRCTIY